MKPVLHKITNSAGVKRDHAPRPIAVRGRTIIAILIFVAAPESEAVTLKQSCRCVAVDGAATRLTALPLRHSDTGWNARPSAAACHQAHVELGRSRRHLARLQR